ncbi:hypothetical protein ACHAP5_011611 [Fusarium lateritium]
MPRNRDGSSDNGPFEEPEYNIVPGAGEPDTDCVDRAVKTADLPESKYEERLAIKDVNVSGSQSQGIKKGDNVGQRN